MSQLTLDIKVEENVLFIFDTYQTITASGDDFTTECLKFVAKKTLMKNIYKAICINDPYMDQIYYFKRVSKVQFRKLF